MGWRKRITTGEGSYAHAVKKHPDVYQAGRNRADSEIRERQLTPRSVWELDWHQMAWDAYTESEPFLFAGSPVRAFRFAADYSMAFRHGFWERLKEFAGPMPQ